MHYDMLRIARSMLLKGGYAWVISVDAHFDESGTDSGELTVAGYLIESDSLIDFCDSWMAVLNEYDLPFFHMVDCAHGSGAFKDIAKEDRIKIQMRMMRIIKDHTVNGIVSNISNVKSDNGESYLSAIKEAVAVVADWCRSSSFDGKFSYIFEAGAKGQGLADIWFSELENLPTLLQSSYAGHDFVPKLGNPGVQAADLLAWQYHNFTKKRQEQSLARLDLRALLRHPHAYADNCGEPPRDSAFQSVERSRLTKETVYFLPPATKFQIENGTVIKMRVDARTFSGIDRGKILACSNCYRALVEDMDIKKIRDITVQCWCGHFSHVYGFKIPEYPKESRREFR